MRYCKYCENEKIDIDMNSLNQCKLCVSLNKKKYYQENKITILNDKKKYYEDNWEEVYERNKIYAEENRQENNAKKREKNKNLTEEEKDKRKNNNRKYSKTLQYKSYHNEYNKIKRRDDPSVRIREYISKRIGEMLNAYGSSKNGEKSWDYILYTPEQLRIHIENLFQPWMTWENHGKYNSNWNDNDPTTWTWNLDHIVPQSILPYSSMTDQNFKTCWALWNLRPLSAKQNQLDGCTRARHHLIVLI